ncbi:hypothetical protein KY290_015024 [Solanum tuberosum]|uniref:Uncharacterized protein n=1 Tax=Solanum tuberosum TaxID=4113 RepID=A0ABQ7VT25_SOLTU|nr:hypothetical protein KY290_015024 [Solanum tuberosum]
MDELDLFYRPGQATWSDLTLGGRFALLLLMLLPQNSTRNSTIEGDGRKKTKESQYYSLLLLFRLSMLLCRVFSRCCVLFRLLHCWTVVGMFGSLSEEESWAGSVE